MTNERQKVANFRAWEMEMKGRAIKARLVARIEGIHAMWKFYREMYGKKNRALPPV